jgi:hypothetical protein
MVRKCNKRVGAEGKIRNATPTTIDGIAFKSKLEAYTYQKLKDNCIEADYEPKSYELLPKFEYLGEKIRPISYKPDFVSNRFIIECKGFANDAFPLRFKLFKHLLHKTKQTLSVYLVKNRKEVDGLILKLKDLKEITMKEEYKNEKTKIASFTLSVLMNTPVEIVYYK